jgi:hypothetical protein
MWKFGNEGTLTRAILHEGLCIMVGLACQLDFSISIEIILILKGLKRCASWKTILEFGDYVRRVFFFLMVLMLML